MQFKEDLEVLANFNQNIPPHEEESNWIDELDEDDQYLSSSQDQFSSNYQKKRLKPYKFKPETIALVESAFLASTASLIWLISYYFRLGTFLKMFFPLPISLIYLRRGMRASIITTIVCGLLLSILIGPTRSVLYILPYGLMGIQLGVLWQRKSSWYLSIFIAAIIAAIGLFFQFSLLSLLVGEDLWVYIIAQMTNIADWIFLKLGILAQPTTAVVQIIAFVMIFFNSVIYALTVHIVALLMLDRLNNPIPRPPKWLQVILDYE